VVTLPARDAENATLVRTGVVGVVSYVTG